MTRILSFFLWLSLGLGILLLALLANGVSQEAEVAPRYQRLAAADAKRVERLLQQSLSAPSRPAADNHFRITATDLNLAANQLIGPVFDAGIALQLQSGVMQAQVSWALPDNPLGRFFNAQAQLVEQRGILNLSEIRIGKLAFPLNLELSFIAQRLPAWIGRPALSELAERVQAVHIHNNALTLIYADHRLSDHSAQSATPTTPNQQAIVYYHRQLAALLKRSPASLGELMAPLFTQAQRRSVAGDAAEENRAVLAALGHYAVGKSAWALAGMQPLPLRLPNKPVKLHGRWDLSQHYLASAALSAVGGSELSRTAGVLKELKDSRGGSGFSFVDLVADHAGALLGQKAVESNRSARLLQAQIAGGLSDAQILPAFKDFPEGMSEAQFKRAFHDTHSPRYKKMLQAIDRRIATLKLYRTN